ncbi:MAG: hypothetical protein JWM41_2022 [Gemmatimonadetes bacterium]|nr:hypothetical protein [Gemmatimonadota bacterium]
MPFWDELAMAASSQTGGSLVALCTSSGNQWAVPVVGDDGTGRWNLKPFPSLWNALGHPLFKIDEHQAFSHAPSEMAGERVTEVVLSIDVFGHDPRLAVTVRWGDEFLRCGLSFVGGPPMVLRRYELFIHWTTSFFHEIGIDPFEQLAEVVASIEDPGIDTLSVVVRPTADSFCVAAIDLTVSSTTARSKPDAALGVVGASNHDLYVVGSIDVDTGRVAGVMQGTLTFGRVPFELTSETWPFALVHASMITDSVVGGTADNDRIDRVDVTLESSDLAAEFGASGRAILADLPFEWTSAELTFDGETGIMTFEGHDPADVTFGYSDIQFNATTLYLEGMIANDERFLTAATINSFAVKEDRSWDSWCEVHVQRQPMDRWEITWRAGRQVMTSVLTGPPSFTAVLPMLPLWAVIRDTIDILGGLLVRDEQRGGQFQYDEFGNPLDE